MAECKCTEINNLSNDIEVLSGICTKLCTCSPRVTEIVSNNELMSKNEYNIYDGAYRVSPKMDRLKDTIEQEIQDAINSFSDKLKELSNRKTDLEAEDKEYHDSKKEEEVDG